MFTVHSEAYDIEYKVLGLMLNCCYIISHENYSTIAFVCSFVVLASNLKTALFTQLFHPSSLILRLLSFFLSKGQNFKVLFKNFRGFWSSNSTGAIFVRMILFSSLRINWNKFYWKNIFSIANCFILTDSSDTASLRVEISVRKIWDNLTFIFSLFRSFFCKRIILKFLENLTWNCRIVWYFWVKTAKKSFMAPG